MRTQRCRLLKYKKFGPKTETFGVDARCLRIALQPKANNTWLIPRTSGAMKWLRSSLTDFKFPIQILRTLKASKCVYIVSISETYTLATYVRGANRAGLDSGDPTRLCALSGARGFPCSAPPAPCTCAESIRKCHTLTFTVHEFSVYCHVHCQRAPAPSSPARL